MTAPRPTVRELAAELRVLGDAAFVALRPESARFITDALLGSNLPLDAPYYPEPQKFMAPKPQSAVGDYTWNHQKGDWEVHQTVEKTPEEHFAWIVENHHGTPAQELMKLAFNCALLKVADHIRLNSEHSAWLHAQLFGLPWLSTLSPSPTGVNAGTALQDGLVSTEDWHGGYGKCPGTGKVWVGDGEQSNFFTGGPPCPNCSPKSPEGERIVGGVFSNNGDGFRDCPPIPTPASTAGAVELQLLQDAHASLVKLCACYGYELDCVTPKDWSEWQEARRAHKELESAIAAWNRRASPASATIARLKEAMTRLASNEAFTTGKPGTPVDIFGEWIACRNFAAQALADLAKEE